MSEKKDGAPAKPAEVKPAETKPAAAAAPGGAWNVAKPFVYGGISGMAATCCVQPIDMVKVRIQLLGEGGQAVASRNPLVITSQLIKNDGFFSLYKGLSAGLLRQATYTTARLGIFRTISNSMATADKKPLPFWKKSVAGLAAGGLGSVFGTPCDVALLRMQADGTLPVDKRRNYKNVIDALVKITKTEGFSGMFKGNVPVVYRAMALNVGMLATHDQALESLKQFTTNDDVVKIGAKLLSGFFASFCSLPFDFVKTRIQKQVKGPDGTYPYKSFASCVGRVMKEEGPMAFYRGFWTYYVRIAPHAMITLFVLEKIEIFEKSFKAKPKA
jgi:solute carrier family 25 oxoglutarate transporter 11